METTPAAPSATPAPAAPANPAAPTPAAPSAAASPTPQSLTLADYDALASKSILANTPGETPPTAPATAPAPESPAEPVAQPEGEAVTDPTPESVQTPGAEEDPEPTAEELAGLGDAGKRALLAERQKRKEAREENKQLRARLEALEAKLTPPTPAAPEPAAVPPAAPVAAANGLADCQTLEAVDARAMQAVSVEAAVVKMQSTLARNGVEPVIAQLKADGVKINGQPVDENTPPEVISDFLAGALEGAKMTQIQAAPRKQFLGQRLQSYQSAVQAVPELLQPETPQAKQFAHLLQTRPELRNLAIGPELAAKLVLGHEAYENRMKKTPAPAPTVPPAAPAKPAPAKPAPKAAPGAPKTSAAALPQKSELDTLRQKLADGTATEKDMDRYGALSVST